MKKFILFPLFLLLTNFQQANALSFVNYQGFTNPSSGTLIIWINADTNFGEGVMAQIRYGAGPTFSGFVVGEFDNVTFPGANWKVTVSYPTDVSSVDIEVAGCSDFGNCTGTGFLFSGFVNTATNLLLPVEFSSFTAKANQKSIDLKWRTESEFNNSHFEIERSSDSRTWERIAQVKGQGFSYDTQEYNYSDVHASSGFNYYRLRQVDFDGQFDFSETVVVQLRPQQNIGLFPNPAKGELFISLPAASTTAQVSIYQINGQLQKTWIASDSIEKIAVDFLHTGMYYLIVRDEQGSMIGQEKFVKQ